MSDAISQMTPLLPERADDLQDLALEIIQCSASLGTRQHPITLHTLRELLRIINSFRCAASASGRLAGASRAGMPITNQHSPGPMRHPATIRMAGVTCPTKDW